MIGNKPLRPPLSDTFTKMGSYESKAKRVSISASIFSVIIYISVFYVYDLSPSIVLKSSKFWFFISNTLIIIIAADYGSYSSSCGKVHDPYDEYVATSRQPMSDIYHQPRYTRSIDLKNAHHADEMNDDEDGVVEVKNMIFSKLIEPKEDEEIGMELVVDETLKVQTQDTNNKKVPKENVSHTNTINNPNESGKKVKKFRRTMSEKLPKIIHQENKNVVHRLESQQHGLLVTENENEEKEEDIGGEQFGTMTDEELNKRVEDFIQKFNRHIRLERNISF